jgi:hypothetical protein
MFENICTRGEAEENCKMTTFIICTAQEVYSTDQFKGNGIGEARGTKKRDNKCSQNFSSKYEGKTIRETST